MATILSSSLSFEATTFSWGDEFQLRWQISVEATNFNWEQWIQASFPGRVAWERGYLASQGAGSEMPCSRSRLAFQSGQNCQQFSWSKPVPISWSNTYFYGQNSHFCCQNWFLMFRPTNFLDHEISWSPNFYGETPFHSNAKISHSIPILCSTLFHSNSISWSVTISWSVIVSIYGTCTWSRPRLPVGSRVIRQVNWVLEPVEWIACNVNCLHNLSKIWEIVAREFSCILPITK